MAYPPLSGGSQINVADMVLAVEKAKYSTARGAAVVDASSVAQAPHAHVGHGAHLDPVLGGRLQSR